MEFLRCDRHWSSLLDPLVDLHVVACGCGPRVVLSHAVAHQALPFWRVAESSNRHLHGIEERLSTVLLELESSALSSSRIELLDCVVESPGRTHDGHRTVFQAVKLVQSRRLLS